MADDFRMALEDLLRKAQMEGQVDMLRESVQTLAQALMDLEVEQHVGAGKYERTATRTGQRNGTRERQWDTRVGTIELSVPRVRDGSCFPSLLDPRKRAERALTAVVQEAYVQGVSTRRVDDLVKSLGMTGISKSQVSRLCQDLDEEVARFRSRRLEGPYPYVWLDATYLKVRKDGRVTNMAVVIAIAVNRDGEREVLGLDVGPSEDGAFWLSFLRSLVTRGLSGVQLVVSDCHEGHKGAIAAVLHGAGWQRCRVHFVRNALAGVPKSAQQMVAATIRTVFAQPDEVSAHEQWRRVADSFRGKFERAATLMEEAEADVLAYLAFPRAYWNQIWSNNPLEQLNKEIKRRTDVVGIFPNEEAVIRLVGAVLAEQHDEWHVARRYLNVDAMVGEDEAKEVPVQVGLLVGHLCWGLPLTGPREDDSGAYSRSASPWSRRMPRVQKAPLRSLTADERHHLERISRSQTEPAGQVARAKALLAVADGQRFTDAARLTGRRSGDAVGQLVARFNREGLAALEPGHGGGQPKRYTATEQERILQEVRRAPDREQDKTATWSLSTLQGALRRAPDGLPGVSTYTIWCVLRDAGFTWDKDRSWCEMGTAVRKRKSGTVVVHYPDATPKNT